MLLCNQVSRVIEPLTSRCAKLRFAPVDRDAVMHNLQRIIACEPKFTVSPDAISRIAELSNGDMRSAINLLQSACIMSDQVDQAIVDAVSGDIPDHIVDTVYGQLTSRKPFLTINDTLNTLIHRQSYSANKFTVKLLDRLLADVSVDDLIKARVAVYAGQVDARGGNEYIHMLALVGCIHDAFSK